MEILSANECIITAIILGLIALDFITGISQAIMNHDFQSKKIRQGIWHKTGIIMVMVLTWLLEEYGKRAGLPQDLVGIIPIINTAIVIMESGSILENISKMNPELRKLAIFRVLKDENDKLDKEGKKDEKDK